MQALASQTRSRVAISRARPSSRASTVCVKAEASRRDALLAGAAVLSPLLLSAKEALAAEVEQREGYYNDGTSTFKTKTVKISNLSTFAKADQKNAFRSRAEASIKKFLVPADAPALIRLAFEEAGDYNSVTKTGGFDGDVINNASPALSGIISKLKEAKKDIDAGDKVGAGPISWADLIYLSGRLMTLAYWLDIKIAKSGAGAVAAGLYNNPWPATIGRVDAASAASSGVKVPAADAPVEEIRSYLLKLGAKPGDDGPFSAKPPFWDKPGFLMWTAGFADIDAEEARLAGANAEYAKFRKYYDASRNSVGREDYEIDFANLYNLMCSERFGAKFNPDAYLHNETAIDYNVGF